MTPINSINGFSYSIEPKIIFDDENFAVVYKPRGLPSAPLKEGDNSLLTWFLKKSFCPEKVKGKKPVEEGLLHRLDTATCGLVLIAKKQSFFDAFCRMQKLDKIKKTYFAFCDKTAGSVQGDVLKKKPPLKIESAFQPFGPKGKTVKPVFSGSRKFSADAKLYTTTVTEIENTGAGKTGASVSCFCSLTQGYRHQVRAHLAAIGIPICGDALYNSVYISETSGADKNKLAQEVKKHSYPLQLYALGIEFPNPDLQGLHKACRISFLLPQPDKMTL